MISRASANPAIKIPPSARARQPDKPALRLLSLDREIRNRRRWARAILYWIFGGLGIALAVFVLTSAARAEMIRLAGSGGANPSESIEVVKVGGESRDYVRAHDLARILRGRFRYDGATRIFVLSAGGKEARFLTGSMRFVISKPGMAQVAGRLPHPALRYHGASLLSRASALSFLKQFNAAEFRRLPTSLLERIPIPLRHDQTRDQERDQTRAGGDRRTAAEPTAAEVQAACIDTLAPIAAGQASRVQDRRASGSETVAVLRRLAPFIRNIVIDAGHGDHDAGAIGPSGLKEKDINLDVALKLAETLASRVSGKVTLTRHDDTFLSLRERVAVAKRVKADLFISVHTNSSPGRNRSAATGSEVFFFSAPSDADAARAERLEGGPFDPKVEGIDPVLWDLMLAGNVVESHKLAEMVSRHLPRAVGLPNRGIKSARFYVMYYGVMSNIPSILVELGFVSNPTEEAKLADPAWRQKAADAIASATLEFLTDLEKRYPGGRGWR